MISTLSIEHDFRIYARMYTRIRVYKPGWRQAFRLATCFWPGAHKVVRLEVTGTPFNHAAPDPLPPEARGCAGGLRDSLARSQVRVHQVFETCLSYRNSVCWFLRGNAAAVTGSANPSRAVGQRGPTAFVASFPSRLRHFGMLQQLRAWCRTYCHDSAPGLDAATFSCLLSAHRS